MIVIGVAEALKQSKGDTIPCVKGKIKKVFEQKTGKSDKGEYTRQGIILSDLKNPKKEISITLFNHDEVPDSIEGETVWIYGGKKGGVSADEYKGKIQLTVSKAGTMSEEDPSGDDSGDGGDEPEDKPSRKEKAEEEPGSEENVEADAKEAARKKREQEREGNADDRRAAGLDRIKTRLNKSANCLVMAADATLYTMKSFAERHEVEWSDKLEKSCVQAIVDHMAETTFTTLFLSLKSNDRDINLAADMPVGFVNKLAPLASKSSE